MNKQQKDMGKILTILEDNGGRAYIPDLIRKLPAVLGCSEEQAVKYMRQLEAAGRTKAIGQLDEVWTRGKYEQAIKEALSAREKGEEKQIDLLISDEK